MRIKEGCNKKVICGEYVVIAQGIKNIDLNNIISLNESASVIWDAIVNRDFTVQDMVNALAAVYEVDEATATKDCEHLISVWRDAGVIEE